MALPVHLIWLYLLPPYLSQSENVANITLIAMSDILISVLIP